MNDDKIQQVVGNAISDALNNVEVAVVTKWVLLAESVNGDGERGLWLVAPEDAKAWDTIGMLTYALHLEQARTIQRESDDD